MRRLLFALIVGILTFSASGVASLVKAEPCEAYESQAASDSDCAPTCVTCGCCAQPTEVSRPAVVFSDEPVPVVHAPLVLTVADSEPHDILHVPKTARP